MSPIMCKKILLAVFLLIFIGSVSAANYCKMPGEIYYPPGFNYNDILEGADCLCNIKQGNPGDAFPNTGSAYSLLKFPDGTTKWATRNGAFDVPKNTSFDVKSIGGLRNRRALDEEYLLSGGTIIIPKVDAVVYKLVGEEITEEVTKDNNPECGVNSSCYALEFPNYWNLCAGKTSIENVYTFSEPGTYKVALYVYQANNAAPNSKTEVITFHVTVPPDLTPPQPPPPPPLPNFCEAAAGIYIPPQGGLNNLSQHCWCNVEQAMYGAPFSEFAEFLNPAGQKIPEAMDTIGEYYIVSSGTRLRITSIGNKFPNIYSGTGAKGGIAQAAEVVVVRNGKEIGRTTNNYTCEGHGISCYLGAICSGDTFIDNAFTFTEAGDYIIKLNLYAANNAYESSKIKIAEFIVKVISIPLAVSSTKQKILAIDGQDDYVNIVWTITNLGNQAAKIHSIEPFGCTLNSGKWTTQNGSICTFDNDYSNYIINPDESLMVVEKISREGLPNLPSAPADEKLGLHIYYGDTSDYITSENNNFIVRKVDVDNSPARMAGVTYVFLEERKFNVELLAGKPKYCIGPDGKIGGTGAGMLPRVKFDWKWSSWSGTLEDFGNMLMCDKEYLTDKVFYYCDPTQFSITLVEKLEAIKQVQSQGTDNGIEEELLWHLQNFQSYLIGDNYNEDFKKDFAYYYSSIVFAEVPSYFAGSTESWSKYFNDESRITFSPERVDSGLYDVTIEITYGADEEFFDNTGKPSATITVKLTRVPGYYPPSNPLYFLPFNGEVGNNKRPDELPPAERTDYGVGFKQGGDILNINYDAGAARYIELKGNGGLQANGVPLEITTNLVSDFTSVNVTNRGMLISIEPSVAPIGANITFSPSKATPVFAAIMAKSSPPQQDASLYYYITENNNAIGQDLDYMNYWSGLGSTNDCKDFFKNPLFFDHADSKAGSGACNGKPAFNSQAAFGFKWKGIPNSGRDQLVLLKTIVYTPDNVKRYEFNHACISDNSFNNSLFMAKDSCIFQNNKNPMVLGSNYYLGDTGGGEKTLQQVFDLVEEEKACILEENYKMEVWWNAASLYYDFYDWWVYEFNGGPCYTIKKDLIPVEMLTFCGVPGMN